MEQKVVIQYVRDNTTHSSEIKVSYPGGAVYTRESLYVIQEQLIDFIKRKEEHEARFRELNIEKTYHVYELILEILNKYIEKIKCKIHEFEMEKMTETQLCICGYYNDPDAFWERRDAVYRYKRNPCPENRLRVNQIKSDMAHLTKLYGAQEFHGDIPEELIEQTKIILQLKRTLKNGNEKKT